MSEDPHEWLKNYIKEIPDFPTPGINFKDIMPLLADKSAFQYSIQKLSDLAWHLNAEAIVAIESRGFIFAAPVAYTLGIPFVPIRKQGKLPGLTAKIEYSLEYGKGELEIPAAGLRPASKVVVIDDVLATGGTAIAAKSLVQMLEAETVGFLFLIELSKLSGRSHLGKATCHSLLKY